MTDRPEEREHQWDEGAFGGVLVALLVSHAMWLVYGDTSNAIVGLWVVFGLFAGKLAWRYVRGRGGAISA